MAYRNLVAQAIATRAEIFKRFRDWVCRRNGSYDYSTTGLGWTLHDAVYATDENTIAAGDYFVIYSPGEDGKKDLYWQVIYSSNSGFIQLRMWQYWNATTHAGVNGQSAQNNWQMDESTSGNLYIYGNLDKILVLTMIGSNKRGSLVGLVDDSVYDRTVATSASSVSSGSSRVVTMDAVPESWEVGRKVVVRDNANMENLTISNIDGNDVTFATFVASYAAGCKFASDYPVYSQSSSNMLGGGYLLIGHNASKIAYSAALQPNNPTSYAAPDPLNGDFIVSPLVVTATTTGHIGMFKDFYVGASGFTHLGVYSTEDGDNYRAFNDVLSSLFLVVREV